MAAVISQSVSGIIMKTCLEISWSVQLQVDSTGWRCLRSLPLSGTIWIKKAKPIGSQRVAGVKFMLTHRAWSSVVTGWRCLRGLPLSGKTWIKKAKPIGSQRAGVKFSPMRSLDVIQSWRKCKDQSFGKEDSMPTFPTFAHQSHHFNVQIILSRGCGLRLRTVRSIAIDASACTQPSFPEQTSSQIFISPLLLIVGKTPFCSLHFWCYYTLHYKKLSSGMETAHIPDLVESFL